MSHTLTNVSPHPFQISEFKDHIRLEITDDDPAAQRSLDTAVFAVEKWTGRITRTATVTQECGYQRPHFRAEIGNPDNIGTLTQIDPNTDVTTDITTKFFLYPSTGWWYGWLRPNKYIDANVLIRWVYTVTTPQIDPDLKLCIFGLAATFYENREQIQQNINLTKLPIGYRSLLDNFRDGAM